MGARPGDDATTKMIEPGNSAGSRLYLKLIGSQYGPQMPLTGPLNQEQIELLKAWIDQGAEWPDDLSGETSAPPPDPKATQVMKALRDGDKQAFKKLATDDPKVGSLKGPDGTTPLMQAVLYGDLDAVRLLLANGADPNIRNEAGATALMWAVGDSEKLRLLLEHGADVNARSNDGRTPLLIAAGQFGSNAAVKLLLDRGASLSTKSPATIGYSTPLSEAALMGNEALLRMFIERGADVRASGSQPLANANRANCAKCLETLLERADQGTLNNAALLLGPPAGDAHAVMTLLLWAGVRADSEIIRKGTGTLLREQRSDGGWAQLRSLESDAYATGQALVALRQAGGVPVTDPSYKRGIEFLLRTQLEDGSWYVKSRSIPLQPFFESGFPHGHDQWISAAGSNWAAMALALTGPQRRK